MKVKELVERLLELDQEAEIGTGEVDWEYYIAYIGNEFEIYTKNEFLEEMKDKTVGIDEFHEWKEDYIIY